MPTRNKFLRFLTKKALPLLVAFLTACLAVYLARKYGFLVRGGPGHD